MTTRIYLLGHFDLVMGFAWQHGTLTSYKILFRLLSELAFGTDHLSQLLSRKCLNENELVWP